MNSCKTHRITAPNFTQIPNVIFDYWMDKLTPAEFKVLLCICRKTFGFHKDTDKISLRQIEGMTGLSRKGVSKNLNRLLELELITKIQSKTKWGDFEANTFEVKVYSEGGGREPSTPGVGNSGNHSGELSTPTKETTTKDNLQKRKKGSPTAPLSPSSSKKIERAEHISTSAEEHEKLLSSHGEEKVQRLYDKLSEWKSDTPKSKWKKSDYLAINRWVLNALREADSQSEKLKKDGSSEDNISYAKRLEENFNQVRGRQVDVRIEAQPTQIVFYSTHPTSTVQPFTLKYKENGFRDRLDQALRKWKLK